MLYINYYYALKLYFVSLIISLPRSLPVRLLPVRVQVLLPAVLRTAPLLRTTPLLRPSSPVTQLALSPVCFRQKRPQKVESQPVWPHHDLKGECVTEYLDVRCTGGWLSGLGVLQLEGVVEHRVIIG